MKKEYLIFLLFLMGSCTCSQDSDLFINQRLQTCFDEYMHRLDSISVPEGEPIFVTTVTLHKKDNDTLVRFDTSTRNHACRYFDDIVLSYIYCHNSIVEVVGDESFRQIVNYRRLRPKHNRLWKRRTALIREKAKQEFEYQDGGIYIIEEYLLNDSLSSIRKKKSCII